MGSRKSKSPVQCFRRAAPEKGMTYKPTLYLKAPSVLDHSSRILSEQLTLIQQVKCCSILTEYNTKLAAFQGFILFHDRISQFLSSLLECSPHGVLPRLPGDVYSHLRECFFYERFCQRAGVYRLLLTRKKEELVLEILIKNVLRQLSF